MTTRTKGASSGDVIVESYRLLSIDPTAAPSGDANDDWLMYRIAQGKSVVTGYRRGSRSSVSAEVERIVIALNERLLVKGRPYRSAGRPKKTPPVHKDLV
jgi:hypothetical protein